MSPYSDYNSIKKTCSSSSHINLSVEAGTGYKITGNKLPPLAEELIMTFSRLLREESSVFVRR